MVKESSAPEASPNDRHAALSPVGSIRSVLSRVDLAEAPVVPTTDLALEPKHQHRHAHSMHGGFAHGDDHIVYADAAASAAGRLDPVDIPAHHHQVQAPSYDLDKAERMGVKVEIGDAESGGTGASATAVETKQTPMEKLKRFCRTHRWIAVLFFGLFFTAWWISIIAQPKTRHRWLIPTFLWLFLMIRFITFYVPTRPLLMAANWVYVRTFIVVRDRIPRRLWPWTEAALTLMTILVATFATKEYPESQLSDRAVSFFGFVVIYTSFYIVSKHRTYIKWHTIIVGIFLQYVIALFVLRTKAGYDFFNWISFLARELLGFSGNGVAFLTSQDFVDMQWFVTTTLASVLFFIAFIHIWYYYGILQWFVGKFSQGFYWLMEISGAEAVVVAATPFVGQGESSILVKPFLPHVTEAEMFQILTSGFATIAGSVLGAYVSLGLNAQALVTSCVMSIPASIASAKLVWPETEEPITANKTIVPEDTTEEAHNVIHAFSNGAWFGMQVAFSIGCNILAIIALVALIDALLTWFGKFWGIPELTLEQIMGYIFYPMAFLLGCSRDGDLYKVGRLLGIKIIQNEFVAYTSLAKDEYYSTLSLRSRVLATYALCGFSNLGSAGIQLGVLAKVAPLRKATIAKMLFGSLLVGCLTTYSSACVAGMVMANMEQYAAESGI